jgi:hypothetical protein
MEFWNDLEIQKAKKSLTVVSRVEGSYYTDNKRLFIIQVGSDDAIVIFGINRSEVFERGIQYN